MTDEIVEPLVGEDKYLRCRDCGIWFIFTRAEQRRFRERGYLHEPARCPTCRFLRRQTPRRRAQGPDDAT